MYRLLILLGAALLASCSGPQRSLAVEAPQPAICVLLQAHPGWAEAVRDAADRWGAPAPLILAIVRQESNFQRDPRSPAVKGPFGYAQATLSTWSRYRRETGRLRASRNDFADSVDFIGWYVSGTQDRQALAYSRTEAHYLVYSRGPAPSGPATRAARRNAARVSAYSAGYQRDLEACPLRAEDRTTVADLGG